MTTSRLQTLVRYIDIFIEMIKIILIHTFLQIFPGIIIPLTQSTIVSTFQKAGLKIIPGTDDTVLGMFVISHHRLIIDVYKV